MSEIVDVHSRYVRDLTTPTELPVDLTIFEQVKLLAGNFPVPYVGCEALTLGQINALFTLNLDDKLSKKADITSVYTKEETYNKEQSDALLLRKADAISVYSKEEIYTKTENDQQLSTKVSQSYVDAAVGAISTDASKQYATLALANADIANTPLNKNVFVSETANGGYWYKATVGATTLTKSPFDPVTQSKIFASDVASTAENNAKKYADHIARVFPNLYKGIKGRLETQADESGNLRVITSTTSGEYINYAPEILETQEDIEKINNSLNGLYYYKHLKGFIQTLRDTDGNIRVVMSSTSGDLINYAESKQKQLIAGAGIAILETEQSITIEAGDVVYESPNEYVLCLIAGQSNASYYGGDVSLSTAVPTDICKVWDNSAKTIRDLNDGSSAANTCKQTYAPALALEFYKQTGMGLIVVNSAVGSTAQTEAADNGSGNWSTTGTLRQIAVDRVLECRTFLNANNYCYQNGFICWTQGERDGQAIGSGLLTKADYKSELSVMIDFFNTTLGIKLPFVLTATAYYTSTGDNTATKEVRAAQYEICSEKTNAYMGFTGAVKFPNRGLMADGVHYNQVGKNIIGTSLGKITSKLSAGVN